MTHNPKPLGLNPSIDDILSTCLISDEPHVMRVDALPPDAQEAIHEARQRGFRPVSVRWVTGEFAILMCVPGTDMPDPAKVVEAFRGCRGLKLGTQITKGKKQ